MKAVIRNTMKTKPGRSFRKILKKFDDCKHPLEEINNDNKVEV